MRFIVTTGPAAPDWIMKGWWHTYRKWFPLDLCDVRVLKWGWLGESRDEITGPCSFGGDLLRMTSDLSDDEYVLSGPDDFWLHSEYPRELISSGPATGGDCALTYRQYKAYKYYKQPEAGWRQLKPRHNKHIVHFEFGFQRVGWLREVLREGDSPWQAVVGGTARIREGTLRMPTNWQYTADVFYNVLGRLKIETDKAGAPRPWLEDTLRQCLSLEPEASLDALLDEHWRR